jgi:malonate decarboxylase gamma subunit
MTRDEVLISLFPDGHRITIEAGILLGDAELPAFGPIHVIGVHGGSALGSDEAAQLSRRVLEIAAETSTTPILILLDSGSQRMSRRDEQLGLNEYLAHLAKCLVFADMHGHPTAALLYGHTAAGAFLATALAARVLLATPGAHPEVMDLASMSRVTKLPVDVLQERARSTTVFAPGLDNLARTGAVAQVLDPLRPLAGQLAGIHVSGMPAADTRDVLGRQRCGRSRAADVAARVHELACTPI